MRRRLFWGVGLVLLCRVVVEVARWPDVKGLSARVPESTAFIDAWQASAEGAPGWQPVSYAQISPALKRAVLVAEDIDFFSHRGFAIDEMKVAIRESLSEGKTPRGASTITQQLAKNLWLSPSRSPLRKLREAALTKSLEHSLSKHRILELYLNVVEFGPGVFGAEAAARHFFGKSAADLTDDEAAALAASLPHSRWSPTSDSPAYRAHRQRVLSRMQTAEWIGKVI